MTSEEQFEEKAEEMLREPEKEASRKREAIFVKLKPKQIEMLTRSNLKLYEAHGFSGTIDGHKIEAFDRDNVLINGGKLRISLANELYEMYMPIAELQEQDKNYASYLNSQEGRAEIAAAELLS